MPQLIDAVFAHIPSRAKKLVFQYMLVFARFEYVLKVKGQRKRGGVAAQWGSFGTTLNSSFAHDRTDNLKNACEYLMSRRAGREIVGRSKPIEFLQAAPRTCEIKLTDLFDEMQNIRNNLFHGAKFPFYEQRDGDLLRHSLTILNECLELDEHFREVFLTR